MQVDYMVALERAFIGNRGFERKADRVHIFYFSRHYQIVGKIKPLYLTNNTRYLTSNTTKVIQ
jgi:hypothetical protein